MVKISEIESLYKSHSENLEATPPAHVWEQLETSLNAAQKHKKFLIFWQIASAAVVAALVIVGGHYFIKETSTSHTLADSTSSYSTEKEAGSPLQHSTQPTANYQEKTDPRASIYNDNSADVMYAAMAVAVTNDIKTSDKQNPRPVQENIPLLKHRPEQKFFATPKTEVRKLIARSNMDSWKERFNVNQSIPAESGSRAPIRVQVGGTLSPTYSFRHTSGQQNTVMAAASTSSIDERAMMAAGGGLHVNVQMRKNWSIESGLRFARLGQEVHTPVRSERVYALNSDQASYTNLSIKSLSLNNTMGEIKQHQPPTRPEGDNAYFGASPGTMLVDFRTDNQQTSGQIEQMIDYIEVPVTLRYYLINRDLKLSLAAGVSTNWLVGNNAYVIENSNRQNIGETAGISSMSWSSHAGVAFSLPLYGSFSLRLEPRVNYFLSDINENYPGRFRPYSFGIFSGIQYTFGE